MSDRDIKKATTHVNQNEGLIMEKSSPGKKAYKLPPLDVPDVNVSKVLGKLERKDEEAAELPEVSEIEIIRHFTRISTWNYGVDTGLYPLGSCTMKYNARINEVVARMDGLAGAHPYQPEKLSQGAMKILQLLSECLIEITGMDAITLAARGRSAWRTDRHSAGSRLSRIARQSAQEDSHPRLSARHQSRDGRHRRIRRRESEVEREGNGRSRRARKAGD